MSIDEFLARLNIAQKGWGLWLNRNNGKDYHVGQYAFENDRLPKEYVHVDNLDHLAHMRQEYIKSHYAEQENEFALGETWARSFLSQWRH
jgi:hypothetical protein